MTKQEYVTMTVREHVRGGYRERREVPHVVLNGGEVEGTWLPGTMGIAIEFNGVGAIELPQPATPAFRPAPKPARRKR